MKENRRDFLKFAGLTGLGIAGAGVLRAFPHGLEDKEIHYEPLSGQSFNMSGYAAPELSVIRVGVIGLGQRGPAHVRNLVRIEGVQIKALCDVVAQKAESLKKSIGELGHTPDLYTDGPATACFTFRN